jgi:hypothetical protein
MFRYVPMSKAIVESSLWDEPAHVAKLWFTVLALKDRDEVVRYDDRRLYRMAKLPVEQFREALEVLLSPDKSDPFEQPHEGRRMERHPEGFLVLNGAKYQEEMVKSNARMREAMKKARYRERQRLREAGVIGGGATAGEREYEREVNAGGNGVLPGDDELVEVEDVVAREVTEGGEE